VTEMKPCHSRRLGILAALVLVVLTIGVGCRSGPPPTLVEQGDSAFSQRMYRAADQFYAKALSVDPHSLGALHGRARVATVQRRAEDALGYYRRIHAIDRAYLSSTGKADYAKALYAVTEVRLDANNPAGAVETARALVRLAPEYPGANRILARALTAQGRWFAMHAKRREALAHYEAAIETDPSNASAYVGAAEILLSTGKRGEALALLARARRMRPTDTRIRALSVQAMRLR